MWSAPSPAHLVAGIWGTLAVGIFGGGDFLVQVIGILAIGAFMVVTSTAHVDWC